MEAIDREILVQKFSNYYCDETKDDESEAKNFRLYDIQELYYPYLFVHIDYQVSKTKKIHQIELKFLEMIEILSSTKYEHLLDKLRDLTQLDKDIFDGIISSLQLKGHININPLSLTTAGKEAKNKQKEDIQETDSADVYMDSIMGEISSEKESIKNPPKEALELKPKLNFEPCTQSLNEHFSDNKTLRTCLMEALDSKESVVWGITEVKRRKKVFEKLVCLFYCWEEEEKILIVDSKYEKDENLTQRFEKILSQNKLDFVHNPKNEPKILKQHKNNRELSKNNLSLEEGANILVYDFPRYLEYALKNAKKYVYVASPWITIKALQRYQKLIEEALQREIEVSIRYGLKNRKQDIDKESKEVFQEFQKYPKFRCYKGNSHAKVLIFDDEWVIKGSFNWFSFGANEEDKNTGGEEGLLTKNPKTIQESKKEFGEAR